MLFRSNSRLIQPAGDRLFSGAGAAGRSWAESIVLHPAGADQREAAPQPPTSASLVFLSRNGLKRDRSAPGRGRPTGGSTTASSYSGGRSGPIALTHKSCYRAQKTCRRKNVFSAERTNIHPLRVRHGVGVFGRPPIALVVAGGRSGPHPGSSTGWVGTTTV